MHLMCFAATLKNSPPAPPALQRPSQVVLVELAGFLAVTGSES
jgi:hypothetical protein